MKTKTIVTLIFMLSMLMTCNAETGMIEINENYDGKLINVAINYDATVDSYEYITKYNGNYDINGTVTIDGKTYNAEFDAIGEIYTTDKKVTRLKLHVYGKLYQDSEVGFLYKENNINYYGYVENGYITNGDIYFCKNIGLNQGGDILSFYGFTLDGYSEYVITNIIPQEEDDVSTLGYKGGRIGDIIPTIYAYKDPDTGKRVVSETYPTDHDGPVICTPGRIAGEPFFPSDFWTTPKGLKVLEKRNK